MSSQTFVHFRNTNEDILMKSEWFLTLHSNATDTFEAQKGNKDIVKIVHVTLVVQP